MAVKPVPPVEFKIENQHCLYTVELPLELDWDK